MTCLCMPADVPTAIERIVESAEHSGAATMVFRQDDSIAFANKFARSLYPFCDFDFKFCNLSSWYYSTLRAGEITQREALADPDGWLSHIAAARRMNNHLEFTRTYASGKRVLCSHFNTGDGWSVQIRVDAATISIGDDANDNLPSMVRLLQANYEIASYRAMIDGVGLGIAVLDDQGRLMRCNSVLRSVLRRSEGIVVDEDGSIRAAIPEYDHLIQKCIHNYAKNSFWRAREVIAIKTPTSKTFVLVSFSSRVVNGKKSIVLTMLPPTLDSGLLTEILCNDFDLTKRQAEMALSLNQCANSEDVSRMLNITKNTVYVQMKRILKRLCKRGVTVQCQQSVSKFIAMLSAISGSSNEANV